ncbi:MAG: hypothetical protein IJP31_07365 [Lachnospiraceae bacterium]|nr:hypothetical protein [Lachnospiraceae bacterium]
MSTSVTIILGYLILIIFVAAAIAVFIAGKRKPAVDKLEKQQKDYEELLKKYHVPKEHYKIVIGQSRAYSVYNCPAVIWKEGDKVKTLVMRLKPVVSEQDEEDYLFLASQPLVDFIRFDGSEFPDWAIQSDYVKQQFLPYVNVNKTVGGLDYKKQMYWIGTICVYARSLSQVLTMLNRPLSDFENRVEKKELMLRDGALPEAMQEELRAQLGPGKERESVHRNREESAPGGRETEIVSGSKEREEGESLKRMEQAIQVIRDTERKAGEEAATEWINRLYAKLLSEKRYEDLEKATQDEAYRKKLYEELERNS